MMLHRETLPWPDVAENGILNNIKYIRDMQHYVIHVRVQIRQSCISFDTSYTWYNIYVVGM